MYSKYINNITLRELPREPTVGGISLPIFLNMSSKILGGSHSEGLNKISHLSIPIGLVISPLTSKTSYIIPPQTKIIYDANSDNVNNILDEKIFNKLYDQTTYQTAKSIKLKKQKTRRNHKL